MNEKPVKLVMAFEEALTRLARTPKNAVDGLRGGNPAKDKRKAAQKPPRAGGRKTA